MLNPTPRSHTVPTLPFVQAPTVPEVLPSQVVYQLFLLKHLPEVARQLGVPELPTDATVMERAAHLEQLHLQQHQHRLHDLITLPLKRVLHLREFFHDRFTPQPSLQDHRHTTGLSHLGFLVENTQGHHLIVPFQDTAQVVRARFEHTDANLVSAFHRVPWKTRVHTNLPRTVVDVAAFQDRLTLSAPLEHLHFLAPAQHVDTIHIPIHESLQETEGKITYHVMLRTVNIRGRHDSEKLFAESKTEKVYVTYHKAKRKLYRVDGLGVRDFSYRNPFHDLMGMNRELAQIFERRVRTLLLEETPYPDMGLLLERVEFQDLIKVATTPALALHAEVTFHQHGVNPSGEVTLGGFVHVPGTRLSRGFRLSNRDHFRRVFPGMDRRVKRHITPQTFHLLASVAELTHDPNLALSLLEHPVKVPEGGFPVLARLLSSRSSTVRRHNRRQMGQALKRSVNKKGINSTWRELRDVERMLREVVKKDQTYRLPLTFNTVTRLHDMVMRDHHRVASEGVRKRTFPVHPSALLHFEQVVEVKGRQVRFQVVRDNHELLRVGRSMNICVGSYSKEVLSGHNLIVVGYVEDLPRFCVQVKPTHTEQFKLSHNRSPEGIDREVAVQYLELIGMVDVHDVRHTPAGLRKPSGFLKKKPFSVEALVPVVPVVWHLEEREDLPF